MKKQNIVKPVKVSLLETRDDIRHKLELLLLDIGDKPIISITLVKTPLDLVAKTFSSVISLGKFGKVSKNILMTFIMFQCGLIINVI